MLLPGDRQDDSRTPPLGLRAAHLGSTFVSEAAGFLLAGWLLDRFAGTKPWGVAGLGTMGIVVATCHLIRSALRLQRPPPRGPDTPG